MLFALSLFAVVFLRYLIVSAGYHHLLKKTLRLKSRSFLRAASSQQKKEIRWALVSTLVFTVLGSFCLWLYHMGYTRIYEDFSEYSVGYFIFTIVFLLVGYETYYYWLHRWMHHPRVFRLVHKVHHDSIHTSVFTSFSFHPLEAVLQFIFLPIVVVIIPIHYYALGIVLTLWTISAVINHASIEIFPRNFNRHRIGKWLIGATHHDLHHKEFRSNFGLYFTFWDKWMKTESPNYDSRFDEITGPGARWREAPRSR